MTFVMKPRSYGQVPKYQIMRAELKIQLQTYRDACSSFNIMRLNTSLIFLPTPDITSHQEWDEWHGEANVAFVINAPVKSRQSLETLVM